MKRFLILFLIFIFSISAVSAENADLTEDDFIPVNLYQDTYILHDYTSSNVNINISSDVSGVSNDKALVNVNVDCEDNSSFNHYLDIYPNESSSPILVNIHDGAGSFYLPIDNSTDYFTAVFDEGKFDTSYAFTSIRQNFTISDSTEVISPDVDLSWDLVRTGSLYEITLNIKNNGSYDLENVSLYFNSYLPMRLFNYSFVYAGHDWFYSNQKFFFNGTFKANQSSILKIRSEFEPLSFFDFILEFGNCSIASACGVFEFPLIDWTLFPDGNSSDWFEEYTDLRNDSHDNILPGGYVVYNKNDVPVFKNPDDLYEFLIKSNNLETCNLYLNQYYKLDNASHLYTDYIFKIWDAFRYIQEANSGGYVGPIYYPDSSDPCYNNKKITFSMITSNDLVKYYKDETQFKVMLLGEDSSNTTKNASFIINGRTYNRSIDENRISKIGINLGPGVYNITTINPFNGERKTNKITVLSLVESNNLVKYYRNDSQFIVKVFNRTSGNVTFNINGVFYTRMINESGYAKLNINLNPGEYIITTDYNGCKAANNITVLSILSSDDLDMKYHDGSKFRVKVVDGQGNLLTNAEVTFNINGVFYTRTSDANGEAKLNINLMAGEYIITSTYNRLSVSNKITISN